MNHIRVIEAFYDGEELVVRRTQNYDIQLWIFLSVYHSGGWNIRAKRRAQGVSFYQKIF